MEKKPEAGLVLRMSRVGSEHVPTRNLTVAIHRADFLGEGEGDELDYLDGILEHAVEPKRIGTQRLVVNKSC